MTAPPAKTPQRWTRLWQPGNPLFWLFLLFNALSSLCAWVMRTLVLSDAALWLLGVVALGNVGFGLWAAWRLLGQPAPSPENDRP